MPWIVSKIIGDGLSPKTAYRTAAQQYGLQFTNADAIYVSPTTGKPASAFAIFEAQTTGALRNEPGALVLPEGPLDALTLATLAINLTTQGCVIDLLQLITGADLLTRIKARIASDIAATAQSVPK